MPRLLCALIRHGDYHQLPDTPSAHQPFPLNDNGQSQARQAGMLLNEHLLINSWSLAPSIDSSNLLRAWQTADLISQQLDQYCFVEGFDQLAERSMGSASNLTIEQIEHILRVDPRFDEPPPDWKADSHYRLPLQGAESLIESGERVASHVLQRTRVLRNTITQDTIKLFVGHGAAFRHAAQQMGLLVPEQIPQLSMYHCRPIFLELLPDDNWHHIGGEWKIRENNNYITD